MTKQINKLYYKRHVTSSPCLNCQKRSINCHSTCSDYLSYVEQVNAFNKKIRNKNYLYWIGKK